VSNKVTQQDFAFFCRVPTRWSDLDMLGHVNNSRFFSFDESARLEYFDELLKGDPTFWKERGFILARIECDFIAQLHHPANVEIGFRIERIGRSSMNTVGGMFVDGKTVAVSRGVLVWFDYQQQKPRPVPDDVRALIRARERVAPDEST
jgi:acyl-CoA thioester hydrolase